MAKYPDNDKNLYALLLKLGQIPGVTQFIVGWRSSHFEKPYQCTTIDAKKFPPSISLPGKIDTVEMYITLPLFDATPEDDLSDAFEKYVQEVGVELPEAVKIEPNDEKLEWNMEFQNYEGWVTVIRGVDPA